MLVVVGGHSRKTGKTAVVCALIRALVSLNWTAVKITAHAHAGLPCAPGFTEEFEAGPGDTGRYLAAGARRALWLRTAKGGLASALDELKRITASSSNAILESNSVLDHLTPDLYLFVVDYGVSDWKESARRLLPRADALVETSLSPVAPPPWILSCTEGIPRFLAPPPSYCHPALTEFVGRRLSGR